jgi:hypothetical protein
MAEEVRISNPRSPGRAMPDRPVPNTGTPAFTLTAAHHEPSRTGPFTLHLGGIMNNDENLATLEERDAATRLYADDNIAVDTDAQASRGEDGVWVQAWVFLTDDDING